MLDALVAATDDVTVEEFRLADFRCEADARLGRKLLYLLSNTEWVRRTTEHVEIGRARVVDTEVVVDVDLSYLPRAVLDDGPTWLPILAVPPPRPVGDDERDPVTSMEVTDAAGARVSKAPQAEVHRRLAAALAELVLGRLPRARTGSVPGPSRDEHVLLTAALRRLLPGGVGEHAADHGDDPEGAAMLDRGRARVEERLHDAHVRLLDAVDRDLARPRPVLRSRLVEMVASLVGVVHAVVPVTGDEGPTSFAVRLPGRRLRQQHRRRLWTSARAHLRVDLHAASAHSDRVVHLGLPDGMAVAHRSRPGASPAGARIEVSDVRPVEELRALVALALDGDGAAAPSWTRRRLAGLAVDKVETSLEALQHLRAVAGDDPTSRLLTLRRRLLDVAGATSAEPVRALAAAWDGGAWLPAHYERRLVVNTATPGLVHVRASAIEGSAQRATTGDSAVDVDVEVADSTVLDTARDTNVINVLLLALVAGLLLLVRFGVTAPDALRPEVLATVLTLFPAIQASRVDRPDRSTLRGVLSQPTYLLSLATVFPSLLLAAALAVREDRPELFAVGALAAQVGLLFALRRPGRSAGEPALLLTTEHPPALDRLDVLRGTWARTLLADALLLGRLTQGYLVGGPDTAGALDDALDVTLGSGIDEDTSQSAGGPETSSVHGLFHTTAAGHAMSFVLAGGHRPERPGHPSSAAGRVQVRHVPVDPGRLAAVEPPAWIVEAFVGLPPGRLAALGVADHPVTALLDAARADDLPVLLIQSPALPPTYAGERRDWLRLRVGVPFLPGEDLGRLARYLEALDTLRRRHPVRGAARVHVYAVPEFATHQASQTAPDEADNAGRRTGDVLRDIAPGDVALSTVPGLEALAVCAPARVGLAADILRAAASAGPCRLVATTSVVLHGLAALLVVVAPDGAPPGRASDRAPGRAPTPFGDAVRAALDPQDVVEVLGPGRGTPPAAGPRSVVRLQVRVPERPHALRALLGDVADALDGLDTWFALFRVTDGRSVQGRLMARVRAATADAVRRRTQAADDALVDAAARRGAGSDDDPRRRAAVEDDPVVDLAVLRTTAP